MPTSSFKSIPGACSIAALASSMETDFSNSAEFEKSVSIEEARAAIEQAPGIDLNDDVGNNGYPLPLNLAGEDNCQVGRIRKDCAFDNGLSFWVVGDQLLKGAALNAVQIAEEVAKL